MSRHGDITFPWGDGETKFRLAIGQLRELQEMCGAGPAFIAKRLREGSWFVQDIRETIRLGLIGGGLDQHQALAKTIAHVDNYPLVSNVMPAWIILQAAIIGISEEEVGKILGAGMAKAPRSRKEKSPSQASMATAP